MIFSRVVDIKKRPRIIGPMTQEGLVKMASLKPPAADALPETPHVPQAYIRILGTRLGRFVEFEYSLDDGTLAVELILPPKALKEFCDERRAIMLPPDEALAADIDRVAWRAGQPGLLRRPQT